MADTFTKIYIQLVFATKYRAPLIQQSFKENLYGYIGGILNGQGQIPLAIGGVADHIHILFIYKPSIPLSDLVRDIKRDSSAFVNKNRYTQSQFRWQSSYGAFSYGSSQLDMIISYVKNQEEHHQKKTFRKEVKSFLTHYEAGDNPYGWIDDSCTTLTGSKTNRD